MDITECGFGFDIVARAFSTAGFDDELHDETNNLTLFLPDDIAIRALLERLELTPDQFLAREDLAEIMGYHILSQPFTPELLSEIANSNNNRIDTFAAEELVFTNTMDSLLVNGTPLILVNNIADNGELYGLNTVLMPPGTLNLVERARYLGLSYFADALELTNLSSTLSNVSDLTVFAPSNEAFEAFIASNDTLDSIEDVFELNNLSAILSYHILDRELDRLMLSSMSGQSTQTLVTDDPVTIEETQQGVLFINSAQIITPNEKALNGTIHIVDRLLQDSSDR